MICDFYGLVCEKRQILLNDYITHEDSGLLQTNLVRSVK